MRRSIGFCLAVVLSLAAGSVLAAELKSGPQPGDDVGAFQVEKVAGAVNDNVEPGKHLCYRCMLGSKPVVMVFARKADANLASLATQLDKKVADNSSKKLSSFVNLLGKDPAALKSTAKEFATKNKLENVALVVPEDNENGPSDYQISPNAEVTVLIYRNGKVEATHAVAPGKLDKAEIDKILADTKLILE
jgi:hypothetical protein